MEKQDIIKWFGIIIVIVMAASMFAIGTLYMEGDSSASSSSQDLLPSDALNASTFSYTLSFNTTALKELNSFRMIAETTELDKQAIDLAIEKVDGVSKVSSRFTSASGGTWYYFAEVVLKRGSDPKTVSTAVLSLDFFSINPSSAEAMKYMTISSSQVVELYNEDLNITRDYNFGSATLSSLVGMDTLPNDSITVEGTMSLQGATITALELTEKTNLTAAAKQYTASASLPIVSLEEGLMFQGTVPLDLNVNQDALKAELATIDINAQIFLFSFGEQQSFFGSSVKTNKATEISVLLTKYGLSAPILQPATFDLNSVIIPELGKELSYPLGVVKAQIKPNHLVGDVVSLTLDVSVTRGIISSINATEN